MAISGKVAKVRYTSVSGTSSTGEAATLTAATSGDFVQVDSTARRHWLRDSTGFVLLLNGTAVDASNYSLNPVQGKFEFHDTGQTAGTYTANIRYVTSTYLTGGQSWTFDVNTEMLDVTSFATSTEEAKWRVFETGLSEGSMQVERLWSSGDTGPVAYDRINGDTPVIVEGVMENFRRLEAYGWVNADSFQVDPASNTVESFTVEITDDVYYSSS